MISINHCQLYILGQYPYHLQSLWCCHGDDSHLNDPCCYHTGRKEGNVLFNDVLNIFYFTVIWYRTTQIVREETRCRHMGYSFQLTARVPTYRIAHTTAFVTPVVEHWLEREIAQWVNPMKDRSDGPSHHERTFLPRSYISLPEHVWYRNQWQCARTV